MLDFWGFESINPYPTQVYRQISLLWKIIFDNGFHYQNRQIAINLDEVNFTVKLRPKVNYQSLNGNILVSVAMP